MYYNTLLKTITLWCMVICILAQDNSKPKTLTISGQIFDQHPWFNNNFEPAGGDLTINLVNTAIDTTNRIPVLRSLDPNNNINKDGRMYTPAYFQHFFKANIDAPNSAQSGRNFPLIYDVVLTYDEANDVYIYNDQSFFPINKKGFFDPAYSALYGNLTNSYKNTNNQVSNFHFCMKLSTKFTYQGYEVFDFTGDDDVWVFINDRLAIDLGGLHTSKSKSVNLKTLGLVKNTDYNFDFFYCERHTTASTIKITTNLKVFCAWYDYCGVCQGDGSSCCTPSTCTDNDACTIDKCPPATQVIEAGKTFKDYCQHTYDDHYCDSQNDKCVTYQCVNHKQPTNGGTASYATCEVKTNVTTCPISGSEANNCFDPNVKCDPKVGCVKKDKCAFSYTNCNTGKCDGKGGCVLKTDDDCYEEMQNPCSLFSCDVNKKGCYKTGPKCTVDLSDPCKLHTCDYITGNCTATQIPDDQCSQCCVLETLTKCQISSCTNGKCTPKNKVDVLDDHNKCTIDTCDINTGEVTYTPVKCGGCETCNRDTGKCEPDHSTCPKENDCIVQNCVHISNVDNVPTGECQNGDKECGQDDPDKCKIWSCNGGVKVNSTNPDANCQFEKKVCEPRGNCLVGECNSQTGDCVYSNRVCETPAFCIVAECNEAIGCVQYNRNCEADNGRCQRGVCVNGTSPTDGKCESIDYDPKPFICKTAAVVSTAVIAGVTVAGAVALAAFIYGGKKGYDYWQQSHNKMTTGSVSNPLYVESSGSGTNPLYGSDA